MGIFDRLTKRQPLQTLELKKAFDAARFGLQGVPQWPDNDRFNLVEWQRKNELVYACIRKKYEAASDPELIVEKYTSGDDWATVDGHPLVALLERPNPDDTWDTFLTAWIGSEELTGDFYAEIVRNGNGLPIALYPLNPTWMYPIPDTKGGIAYYEFRSGYSPIIRLEPKDVLHRRKPDLKSRYYGLAPLRVALGSVDSDQSMTDFVRAFFHSDGIPAGLLKVLNRSMSKEEANALQQGWMAKFKRGGTNYKQVAVLDQNAEFQTIGSDLSKIEADVTRQQVEARICMVFGVPPALVGAYVGLKLATNKATMKEHINDFWLNTMSPMLKSMRVWITWNLLPEFEDIAKIQSKQVRVNFDMSQVMAMREDDNARHERARDNFAAGMWTINEAREATGQEPLPEDYFIQPKTVDVMSEIIRALVASKEPAPPPALPDPNADPNAEPPPKQIGDGKAMDADFEVPMREHYQHGGPPFADPVKKKSYDFNGLTLGRAPNELEKQIDLKGMVDAYDGEKAKINRILVSIRNDLIKQATDAVGKLSAGDVYTLTLTPPANAYSKLRKEINAAFEIGKAQVDKDLAAQKK